MILRRTIRFNLLQEVLMSEKDVIVSSSPQTVQSVAFELMQFIHCWVLSNKKFGSELDVLELYNKCLQTACGRFERK